MTSWINLGYLVASVLFIVGLKGLTHPKTAVRGNRLGALAMAIAIAVTLLDYRILSFEWILLGAVIGTLVGAISASKVPMTSMPEFVALFNGFGGLASVLVAQTALVSENATGRSAGDYDFLIATALSNLIGAITFTGSMVAFLKLQEILSGQSISFRGGKLVNLALALVSVGATVALVNEPSAMGWFWILCGVASVLGVLLTLPIGGADMPVVIALLNSYSGLAAAATGFVLSNNVLIIAGSLVGASGVILTQIMCKAMNRSLLAVLFGTMEASEGAVTDADAVYAGKVKSTSAEEVAMLLESARKVAIVPGYGLAVSQAQHLVRDLARMLEERGVEVVFAIHPVAGRMPGHMNVLLAEAEVPYDKLLEMDEINPMFSQIDLSLVIGANDVVNPLARTDPNSPIAGMPILDVDQSRTVVVMKRSLSPGFAGIPNPLFAADNTLMFFGDGKKALAELNAAVRASH